MMAGGICPIQSKVFQNVSCAVNGVSFMARTSEILEPVLRMTVPNRIVTKVSGVPYPEFGDKLVGNSLM